MEEQTYTRTYWVGVFFFALLILQVLLGSNFVEEVCNQFCSSFNFTKCEQINSKSIFFIKFHQLFALFNYYQAGSIFSGIFIIFSCPFIGMLFHIFIDVICHCFSIGPYKKLENLVERQFYLIGKDHLVTFLRRRYTGFYIGMEMVLASLLSCISFCIIMKCYKLTFNWSPIFWIYILLTIIVVMAALNSYKACKDADRIINRIDQEISINVACKIICMIYRCLYQ